MTRIRLTHCPCAALCLALLAFACGDASDGATFDPDAGSDTGDTPTDLGVDADAGISPGCSFGIDLDQDGVCDREAADWSRDAELPPSGDRRDIYRLGENLPVAATAGIAHAMKWPVDVSGILLPWDPLSAMLDPGATEADTLATQRILRDALGFGTTDEMFDWLGLARFDGAAEAMAGVPWPASIEPGDALGFGLVDVDGTAAMTFSCGTCHAADLFGRTVLGLSNRRAQANEFFHLAGEFFPDLTPEFFAAVTGATDAEVDLFEYTQDSFSAVATRLPQVRGLDTSLAQVSLSLARRAEDAYATRDSELERRPRENLLSTFVADSKPAVWWTLRYKTRWLSDGSIVSGNPVFTNFLWNELGRGTDLQRLERWLGENQSIVDELTVAVFATESPRWEDWFGVEGLDLDAARRGHALFEENCATCHGSYVKGWDADDAIDRDLQSLVQTEALLYHEQTPVLDVGTDPQRAAGMAAFAARLNELAISEWMDTVVEVQGGYVPPPLDGIWSRYPYLHNQSVPTLCDMLLPASMRTTSFQMGPSADAETDFDEDCVGFPTGEDIPAAWFDDPRDRFDTSLPGLSNAGHDAWLTNEDGSPRFTDEERADLVEFLKTL